MAYRIKECNGVFTIEVSIIEVSGFFWARKVRVVWCRSNVFGYANENFPDIARKPPLLKEMDSLEMAEGYVKRLLEKKPVKKDEIEHEIFYHYV